MRARYTEQYMRDWRTEQGDQNFLTCPKLVYVFFDLFLDLNV